MEAKMNSKTHLRHFRTTNLIWPFIAGSLMLSSLILPVHADVDLPVGILSDVQETGTARIIVTLKMPETNDDLSGAASAGTQGSAIEQAQNAFIRELYPPLPGGLNNPAAAQEVKRQFGNIPALTLEVGQNSLQSILQNEALVESVEIDRLHKTTLSESVPLIGSHSAWNQGYSGNGQVVAILDTGVDKTHPALNNKVIQEACFSTNSSAYNAETLCPDGSEAQIGNGAGMSCSTTGCDHGTHVAGIVAANGNGLEGVAKDANLIAIQVFTLFNSSQYCGFSVPCVLSYTSDQMAALDYIYTLKNGGMDIAAVNMSLGGGYHQTTCNGTIQSFIDKLKNEGVATIVSSGNNGYSDGIASPACIESAISIGATTKSDTVASYSNSAEIIDLLAPGSGIVSTLPNNDTGAKNGTSMAAPHAAGAFAVLKSADPEASVNKILRILKQTGVSVSDTRNGISKPRINLAEALTRLAPAADEPNIEVTPTSHDFGSLTVGESSTLTVTISSTGDSDLAIQQISLPGSDFIVSNDNCSNTTLAPGSDCTVTITFTPTTDGVKTTTLSISSNDPNMSTTRVSLTGRGLTNVDLTPEISVNPSSYDFGYVKVDHSSTVTVTISNTGSGALEIGELTLHGWNFEMSNDNCSNTTLATNERCTVTITLTPKTKCAKNGRLLIPSNDENSATTRVKMKGNGIPEIVTPTATVAPASSELVYGVHDEGLNTSQFFTISLDGHTVNPLGPMYPGYDIEAIAIHPETCDIYAASGNDVDSGQKAGHLYKIDGQNGDLVSVGSTCFEEIGDLAFSSDGTLWGWAKGKGLIEIDKSFGIGTLEKASTTLIEGLSLNQENDGIFYGTQNTRLWEYNRHTDQFTQICSNLPGQMEALETMPDGLLLGGIHEDDTLNVHIFQLESNSCTVQAELAIPTPPFNDVEGIALPVQGCSP
jgi:subtilisin family serine protease